MFTLKISGYGLPGLWCRFRVGTAWGIPPYHPRFWYLLSLRSVWVYATMIIVTCTLGWVGMRVDQWKYFTRRLCLHQISGYGLPDLWCRFRVGTTWRMPVPFKVLVFVVLQICMSVWYHDNRGVYLGLGRYEGWPVEIFYLEIVFAPNIWVRFAPVCDVDLGLVRPGVSPYHPRFWYLLSLLYDCMIPW